jgi:hypothetical protein
VPVRIGQVEEMSAEEFAGLRRAQRARAANPQMEELLDRVEAGQPLRVPLEQGQSARGLRVAIARAASRRGLKVETVEGEGFVAVRRAEQPSREQPRRQPAADGRRQRGRPRRRGDETAPDMTGLSETME